MKPEISTLTQQIEMQHVVRIHLHFKETICFYGAK